MNISSKNIHPLVLNTNYYKLNNWSNGDSPIRFRIPISNEAMEESKTRRRNLMQAEILRIYKNKSPLTMSTNLTSPMQQH